MSLDQGSKAFFVGNRNSSKYPPIDMTRLSYPFDDDDCFYYHTWRNNVVIAFGTLSSFLT